MQFGRPHCTSCQLDSFSTDLPLPVCPDAQIFAPPGRGRDVLYGGRLSTCYCRVVRHECAKRQQQSNEASRSGILQPVNSSRCCIEIYFELRCVGQDRVDGSEASRNCRSASVRPRVGSSARTLQKAIAEPASVLRPGQPDLRARIARQNVGCRRVIAREGVGCSSIIST